MAKQVFLSVLLILCILKVCYGYYWYWYTTERMKTKLVFMTRELIKDAIRNYQRIDHLKEYYADSVVWDIGQMLYFIRSKYARMVRVYILSIENNDKFETFHPHLPSLKEIHHLGMDIYNLVEMLEEYDVTEDIRPVVKQNLLKKKLANALQNNSIDNIPANIIAQDGIPPKLNVKSDPNLKLLLRKRPVDIPSFANQGFYARKPMRALRNKMKRNRQRDIDATFDSDIE